MGADLHLRGILKNTAWLTGLQLISYVLPLLTAPAVTRAFGPELFGFVVTATAASAYVSLFMSYGFPWSGPRLVAREKHDPNALSRDVSAVLAAQFGLGVIGSILFVSWTLTTSQPPELRWAQWSILAATLFTAFVPAWLFQGLERMGDLVIPQLLVRIGTTAAIILTIRSHDDLLLYVAINAVAAFIGLLMFALLTRRLGLTQHRPELARIKARLKESSTVFLSNAAISFYTTANVLIVSVVLGHESAGIFGLADRIRAAVMGLLVPMTQAIYPFVCRTVGSSDPEERLARRRMFQLMIGLSVALGIAMFIAAPIMVSVLGGAHFAAAVSLVKILALIPLLVTVTNILGVQIMLPRKMDRAVATVVIACATIGVILQTLLTRFYRLPGSAWAYVIVELLVCCGFGTALLLAREVRK